jgi:2-hydroxy-3-oxopropionate reductase
MGNPMAKNLIKTGYPLVVYDRNPPKVQDVVAAGAQAGLSSKDVAARSQVTITMLTDSPNVEAVVLGADGIMEGIRPGSTYIDMSTISPVVTRRLARQMADKDVDMLDAPVSGGQVGAINATLSIMVGGRQGVFDRCLPIFQAMGKNIVLIGDSGAGQVAKACNQIVVGLTIEAVSEALVLAAKAGVDPAKVREALLGGFAQSRILDLHGGRMLRRDFVPGFRLGLHEKDLNIALSTARELGVALPATALVHEMMNAMKASGRGELDHSALVTFLEDLARVEVRPAA